MAVGYSPSQWSGSRDAKPRPEAREGARCLQGPFPTHHMSSIVLGQRGVRQAQIRGAAAAPANLSQSNTPTGRFRAVSRLSSIRKISSTHSEHSFVEQPEDVADLETCDQDGEFKRRGQQAVLDISGSDKNSDEDETRTPGQEPES